MKVICLLSGGMDSTTMLYKLISEKPEEIIALSFFYGQKHKKELVSAKKICKRLRVEHKIINMKTIGRNFLSNTSLIDKTIDIPEGHYTAENMKDTVVPNRNMILLSIAIGYAVSKGFDTVAYASHKGDHAIYPDCRPEFVEAMKKVALISNFTPINVFTPFLDMNKTDIVREGVFLNVPFEITWSCYNGREKHCGKCGTCVERKEAFNEANLIDPTEYEVK